tara:strand:- start:608 stop:727 length:120 start_codon:yes stop_codon:yes gene_type:complete
MSIFIQDKNKKNKIIFKTGSYQSVKYTIFQVTMLIDNKN